eukprot:SAG31_NODE_51_length_30464_cov_16.835628_8_plen_67_part_00
MMTNGSILKRRQWTRTPLRDERGGLPCLRVDVVAQVGHDFEKTFLRHLVQVRHRDACRQQRVLGVV